MGKIERIAVFEDTMDMIDEDHDLKVAVSIAKDHTDVYYEDDYPYFDASVVRDEQITVTDERSFQAAMRLSKEHPGAKIAVMNFANAFHPGGGVKHGASAQEESLCRCSTLYKVLSDKSLKNTFYAHHQVMKTAKASDSLIYTEGVVICKTDEDYPKRMDKNDWVNVDVITLAAPDLGGMFAIRMNDAELFGYHIKRAMHMLTVAASKGADTLVLGAFGCGAFQNDPKVVAMAYKTALSVFPKVFDHVVFAVYCSPKDRSNYEVFSKVLGDGLSQN